MRKISYFLLSMVMVLCVCAACSRKDDSGSVNDTPVDKYDGSSSVIIDNSENSSINSSNQNEDTSTLIEEFESGMDSYIEEGSEMLEDESSSDSDRQENGGMSNEKPVDGESGSKNR